MTAVVPAEPFQAEIDPFKLAKMKRAELPVPVTPNPEPPLATWPVGPAAPAGGMATEGRPAFFATFRPPVTL